MSVFKKNLYWQLVILVTVLVSFICSPAFAKIYKWKDDKGKVHFTDSKSKIPPKYRNKTKEAVKPRGSRGKKKTGESRPTRIKRHQSSRENVQISYNYYKIYGAKPTDLRRQMNELGPMSKVEGVRFDANTRWRIEWNTQYKLRESECLEFKVITRAKLTYTMPRWEDYKRAPVELRKKWDRYYQALEVHEQGHGKHGLQALKEIEASVPADTQGKPCQQLDKEFNARAHKIIQKYGQVDLNYDKETQHGMTQGAVFP